MAILKNLKTLIINKIKEMTITKVKHYSYVVRRDFGFAPNPFGRYCTLATCKPDIRKNAQVNSWVFGITPKSKGNKLLFAMLVSEKLDFNQYWSDERFEYKKPIRNGSLKQMYGDNIYFFNAEKEWFQADSHHSLEDGKVNLDNLNRDVSGKYVLVAEEFYYFGSESIDFPLNLGHFFEVRRGTKLIDNDIVVKIVSWLREKYPETGYQAKPTSFTKFQRYDGVS